MMPSSTSIPVDSINNFDYSEPLSKFYLDKFAGFIFLIIKTGSVDKTNTPLI